jgi:phosphoribosylformylglycinamidine synthase subunit PurQ / glutaminase
MKPAAIVVSAPGTNRDHDVAFALELAGAQATRISLTALIANPGLLNDSQIVVFAGGFSHADALGAGTLAGLRISSGLGDDLRAFVSSGRAIIGICNGFQMLVRTGLLPGSLTHNSHGKFVCKWVTLESPVPSRSVWTNGLTDPIECPVAHGEGRYVADESTIAAHQALKYTEGTDPNGSVAATAGVTDSTGLVLGLMPHPENHVLARQHPRFRRHDRQARTGLALPLFVNGVTHIHNRG